MEEETKQGYSIPSQEESLKNSSSDFMPLSANVYIMKIAKIELKRSPSYANGMQNYEKMIAKWNITLLPYATTSGDEMVDINDAKVESLKRMVWSNLYLSSDGFSSGKPSILRTFIAYVSGQDIQGWLSMTNFIVINENGYIVTDNEKRKTVLNEKNTTGKVSGGKELGGDLTEFEGKYIGVNLSVKTSEKTGKKQNRIDSFMALPKNFQQPDVNMENEVMAKFNESYDRRLIENENKGDSKVLYIKSGIRQKQEPEVVNEIDEEVVNIDSVPFES